MMDSFKEVRGLPDPDKEYGQYIMRNVKESFEAAKQREEFDRLRIREEDSDESEL